MEGFPQLVRPQQQGCVHLQLGVPAQPQRQRPPGALSCRTLSEDSNASTIDFNLLRLREMRQVGGMVE